MIQDRQKQTIHLEIQETFSNAELVSPLAIGIIVS